MSLLHTWMESRQLDGDSFRELNRLTSDRLMGMDELLTVLIEARSTGRTVVVFPDFDMDGITSGTLMYAGLVQAGLSAHLYVPTYERSHGFFEPDAQAIADTYGSGTLVITTDTASSSHAGITLAQSLGLEVVVTDHHHEPDNDLSTVGVLRVNPCRNDETYEHPGMCGAAVAFMVLEELATYLPSLTPALPVLRALAGVGTVADVMPMTHGNRLLVRSAIASLRMAIPNDKVSIYSSDEKLIQISRNSTLVQIFDTEPLVDPVKNIVHGLSLLMTFLKSRGKIQSVYDINAETIGFYVAPLFNAIRRVEADMADGFGVFTSEDPLGHLKILESNNNTRKKMAQDITQSLINDESQPFAPWIYLAEPETPKGMLGLVAQNLAQKHQCPTLVLSPRKDEKKTWASGSARAVGDFNVLDFIREHGGGSAGHAQACGAWFDSQESAQEYVQALEAVADSIDTSLKADVSIGLGGQLASVSELELLELAQGAKVFAPFGPGFEAPSLLFTYAMANLQIKELSGGKHTCLVSADGLKFLIWNTPADQFRQAGEQDLCQLKVRVGVSYFNPRAKFAQASAQVVVDDFVIKDQDGSYE